MTAPGTQAMSTGTELTGRTFVLLQGPSSPFFAAVGLALRRRGADVVRIGFCPGDRLYWRRAAGRYVPFRGHPRAFGAWLLDKLATFGATDILMLGDGRDLHAHAAAAIRTAEAPVRVWIVEHGYLRPGYILIEPDGMGGSSTIPARFDAAPEPSHMPDDAAPRGASFAAYAAMDVGYHMANLLTARVSYPHYRAHSGVPPLEEYRGWAGKLMRSPQRRAGRSAALDAIARHGGPLYLFPLQLSQDTQLTKSGTGEPQETVLDGVARSFLDHAPDDAMLVVKVHPLDNGLTDWAGLTADYGERVLFLDGGDLDALLARAAGVVTINSTVGLQALRNGVPVHALGRAIYRAAGLTDRQPLDTFWAEPGAPDQARVDTFIGFLRSNFHVRGTFDGPGAQTGAEALADWLAAPPDALGPAL